MVNARVASITSLAALTAASLVASRFTPPGGDAAPTGPIADRPPVPHATGPAPALSPEQQHATFLLAEPGLMVELVAAEPLIEAPVAAAFDEDGRLWVVEMRTYMRDTEGRGELDAQNRIRVLRDADGDGRMDDATTFLDGLVLPRSVLPCFGGAMVIAPPRLLFARDTDGDGRADDVRSLAEGLSGLDNPEHAPNSLTLNLDGWIAVAQHGTEYHFDGTRVQTRRTPVVGQWGLAKDDVGRLYSTPNSNPLLADLWPRHYAGRGWAGPRPGAIGRDICGDASVWPAHATPGVNRAYMPNVLRTDGTLASHTAACGPTILRSAALGDGLRGDVFLCDPAANIVKRLVLRSSDGLSPRASNPYERREFLASTDERFRPVSTLTGPDGSLLIVDMSRGVIQHKNFITPYLAEHARRRGLETPLTAGRIWRVRRADARPTPALAMSRMSDAELADRLADENGWVRDTAQRLLVERKAVGVAATLEGLAASAPAPASLHALWTLHAMGAMTPALAATAANHADQAVRADAARFARSLPADERRATLLRLATDPHPRVALHAWLELAGEPGDAGPTEAMARLGKADTMQREALLSGMGGREADALRTVILSGSPAPRDLASALVESGLRHSPAAAWAIVELTDEMRRAGRQEAAWLVDRLKAEVRLGSDSPTVLALSREPTRWMESASGDGPEAAVLRALSAQFEWPDRPPVRRAVRVPPLSSKDQERFSRGQWLYDNCVGCHAKDGRGSPGMAPALAASKRVLGPPDDLARIVLHGLEGPYTVAGSTYHGVMPPHPHSSDADIAAILTYVRRAWGNTASPVEASLVTQMRERHKDRSTPWTAAELDR